MEFWLNWLDRTHTEDDQGNQIPPGGIVEGEELEPVLMVGDFD